MQEMYDDAYQIDSELLSRLLKQDVVSLLSISIVHCQTPITCLGITEIKFTHSQQNDGKLDS